MAYDSYLAERITQKLTTKGILFETKKMMGGLTFMVDDKMCVGVYQNKLMARIDPEDEKIALAKAGAEEMKLTKRKMKGFVFVDPIGLDTDKELDYWISLRLKYNPKAKSSKQKKQ
ncbi:MAG: TfoX/Sxy family protein [Bacteroidetes bacterium]|nr:TfoX/Sxy family protein [Bacteroidota bacterium]